MFRMWGFILKDTGVYLGYTGVGVSELYEWDYIREETRAGFIEIAENPGVCFFVMRPQDNSYEDTLKFPTLEAAVAAAVTLGGTK